jgi:hypothetical protein
MCSSIISKHFFLHMDDFLPFDVFFILFSLTKHGAYFERVSLLNSMCRAVARVVYSVVSLGAEIGGGRARQRRRSIIGRRLHLRRQPAQRHRPNEHDGACSRRKLSAKGFADSSRVHSARHQRRPSTRNTFFTCACGHEPLIFIHRSVSKC